MTTVTPTQPDSSITADRAYGLAAGEGQPERWWLSGHIAVKARGADTEGRFCQLEFRDPLGLATPRHIHHREDETFYVLDGEVTIFIGDAQIDASGGDFVFAPRDVPHAYVVRSETARMLVTYAPAGVEEGFIELGVPVDDRNQPPAPIVPDPEEFARQLARYGVELVGPPPTLER